MGYPTTSIEKQQQANAVISKGYEDRMNYQSFRLVRPRTFTYAQPDESEARPEQKTINPVNHNLIYLIGAMSIIVVAGLVLKK